MLISLYTGAGPIIPQAHDSSMPSVSGSGNNVSDSSVTTLQNVHWWLDNGKSHSAKKPLSTR